MPAKSTSEFQPRSRGGSQSTAGKETLGFQAEVRQLLDLMVHSLYGNKEVFLRELISNASDALDKLRFEALSDESLFEGEGELRIHIEADPDARTITVRDNGIGMTRQEVVENIGTIARSGTQRFFEALTGDQAKDAQLIGQFGVGFYSSFIVADRVTLVSRKAGAGAAEGVRWDSDGQGSFTVEDLERSARGTEVTLHLREGEDELLDGYHLRSIVTKYSDHISFPILMRPQPAGGEEAQEEPGEPEPVNRATALWTRSRNEITEEEYEEFYKHVSHDFEGPLETIHSRVEGNLEYTSLLYIPKRAPFDLWDRHARRGVKLYVRRVFIMDDAEHLMPSYLRFVRGVVDSADLPLNVSREILQSNRQIDSMRAGSVKKVLGALERMARDEPERYQTFWKEFGKVLKEGIIDDLANREEIAKLLRLVSTASESDQPQVSLADYLGRMKDGQEAIYYLTADSLATARNSPHLEIFSQKGIEVLLLTDEVDEWVVNHLTEFEGKPLRSVSKGELELGQLADADPGEEAEVPEEHRSLVEGIAKTLGERVKEVRVSRRLTASPACLVAGEHEMGRHLEQILKAAGQPVAGAKPVLEVNVDHPLVRQMREQAGEPAFEDWAWILHDQALLSEGGQLDDPAGFVKRMNAMFQNLAGGSGEERPAASE